MDANLLLFIIHDFDLNRMHYVHYKSGFWVYNVFEVLNTPLRAAFIFACVLLSCAFYFTGEKVNSLVWGKYCMITLSRLWAACYQFFINWKVERDQGQAKSQLHSWHRPAASLFNINIVFNVNLNYPNGSLSKT